MPIIKQDARGVPTIEGSVALVFFGLGLVLFLFVAPRAVWVQGSAALRGVYDDGEPMPTDFRMLYGAFAAFMAACWLAAIPLAFAYFRRRSKAPRFILMYLGATFAANLLVTLGEILLVGDGVFTVVNLMGLALSVPITLGWALHFARSKRVKATFVYPLDDAAESVQ